jgi:hypothetical protein
MALVILPLCIFCIDAAVLYAEWRQPGSQKALRLVREYKSRKENFTVQQYLYATVYHRKDGGENLQIEGWRVEPDASAPDDKFSVVFAYTDADGKHLAIWQARVKEKTVSPQNDEAENLSWQ